MSEIDPGFADLSEIEILQKKIWPRYLKLLHSFNQETLEEMVSGLTDILIEASIPPSRVSLALFDHEYNLIFAIQNPVSQEPTAVAASLGFETVAYDYPFKTSIAGRIFDRLRTQGIDNQFLLCTKTEAILGDSHVDDQQKSDSKFAGYYDLFKVNLDTANVEELIENEPFLTNEYIDMLAFAPEIGWDNYATGNYLKDIIFMTFRWPASGDLPEIMGLVAFSIFSDPAKVNVRINDRLKKLRQRIHLLAWVIQASAFSFQAYALSLASSENPKKLTEAIKLSGWTSLLQQRTDFFIQKRISQEEYEKTLGAFAELNNIFLLRNVIRTISEDKDRGQVFLTYVFRTIFNCIELWKIKRNEPNLILLHALDLLYKYGNEENVNKLIFGFSFPLAKNMLGVIDRKMNWPKAKQLPNGFLVALSLMEDVYIHCRQGREEVLRVLETIANRRISWEFYQIDHFISTLFLISLQCEKSEWLRIKEIIRKAKNRWDKNSGFNAQPVSEKIFSLHNRENRNEIFRVISPKSFFAQKLISVKEDLDNIEEAVDERRKFDESPNAFSIVSSKGGVGKTGLALILASVLAGNNTSRPKVCLIDLDFFGPTLNYLSYSPSEKLGQICLNEYIWTNYLRSIEEKTRAKRAIASVFQKNRYWLNYFTHLGNDTNILDRVIIPSPLPGLDIIHCSPNHVLQDLMLPFTTSYEGLGVFSSELSVLLQNLKKKGYEYVIFDNPAELKEVALVTTQLCTIQTGKNIFVSTLYEPSLKPIIEMLSTGVYAHGQNRLIINKVRPTEKKYLFTKEVFLDYLLSTNVNKKIDNQYSYSYISHGLKVEGIGFLPWEEFLDQLLEKPRVLNRSTFEELASRYGKYLSGMIA